MPYVYIEGNASEAEITEGSLSLQKALLRIGPADSRPAQAHNRGGNAQALRPPRCRSRKAARTPVGAAFALGARYPYLDPTRALVDPSTRGGPGPAETP